MNKHRITDIGGKTVEVECLGCAIVTGQVEMRGEPVLETRHFDVHQDYEIPIPGFMVMASKRHMLSVDQFTSAERSDFIETLCRIRSAMRKTLHIEYVYLIQEEDTSGHFHVWIFPRYDWMKERFGRKIESIRPIMEYARNNLKTPANLAELDETINRLRTECAGSPDS